MIEQVTAANSWCVARPARKTGIGAIELTVSDTLESNETRTVLYITWYVKEV
jgi:hypothetical protein